jgi:replicative DNA helicase
MLGKACSLIRLKVLHISLEMSAVRMAQRYVQAFFAVSKNKAQVTVNRFQHDERNKLQSFQLENLNRPTLIDPGIESQLNKKLLKLNKRIQLDIRQFPTSALTVEGLEVFLDSMERLYNFIPDVVLLDYADLMKLDYKNLRTSTGEIYKELRRIAVERNLAMVTASQSNRAGEDARIITLKHLAEDYSKAATADTVVAYCQTPQESSLGLARLFVAKSRNEERNQTILISQAYRIGQFCMDSTFINDRYWTLVDRSSNTGDG